MAQIDRIQPDLVRARHGKASARYTHSSRRIILVADDGHFADAIAALEALRDEVTTQEDT